MTWAPTDYVLELLAQLGAPPTTLDELVKSPDWNWFLRSWATDQDASLGAGVNLLSELWNNMPMSYIEQMYTGENANSPFDQLAPELAERIHAVAEGMAWDDDEERVRTDVYAAVYAVADAWTSTFIDDIQALQGASETVSALAAPGLTRDRIDRAVVDGYNEQVLKGMEKGDWTQYEQSGDVVFLAPGPDYETFAPGYRTWITAQDNYRAGNLQMAHKGKALDPGEIVVTGCTDQPAFKTAIRAVTKKKVTFQ